MKIYKVRGEHFSEKYDAIRALKENIEYILYEYAGVAEHKLVEAFLEDFDFRATKETFLSADVSVEVEVEENESIFVTIVLYGQSYSFFLEEIEMSRKI